MSKRTNTSTSTVSSTGSTESTMTAPSSFLTPAEIGDGSLYAWYESFPALLGRGKKVRVNQTLWPELRVGMMFLRFNNADKEAMRAASAVAAGREFGNREAAISGLDAMVDEIFSATRGTHPDPEVNNGFKSFWEAFSASPAGQTRGFDREGRQYEGTIAQHVEAQWAKAGKGAAMPATPSAFGAGRHLAGLDLPQRPVGGTAVGAARSRQTASEAGEAAAKAAAAAGSDPVAAAIAAVLAARK
jgi:hypothetical protein